MRIILGSGSPRRKELLSGLDIPFTVDTGNSFEEWMPSDVDPHEIPVMMAEGKNSAFHRELLEDELLITADTVVIVGGQTLGKPKDREDAFRMLRLLSGRTHEGVTAVTLRTLQRSETFTASTLVTFAELSDDEIRNYIDKYHPFDKAGSYGVQEWIGYVAFSRLEGSFYNVMGLPVHLLYRHLRKFGAC